MRRIRIAILAAVFAAPRLAAAAPTAGKPSRPPRRGRSTPASRARSAWTTCGSTPPGRERGRLRRFASMETASSSARGNSNLGERADVVAVLVALRKARFGAMPEHFGESEEGEKNEGPRLKGRVDVRPATSRRASSSSSTASSPPSSRRWPGGILADLPGRGGEGHRRREPRRRPAEARLGRPRSGGARR